MHKSKLLGNYGENVAMKYLLANGYIIIARNYHSRYGEIDIIAIDKHCLVFVEVKTRTDSRFYNVLDWALESVNKAKQRKIIKTAMVYLMNNEINLQSRFDVIVVITEYNSKKVKFVTQIKDAFDVGGFNEFF